MHYLDASLRHRIPPLFPMRAAVQLMLPSGNEPGARIGEKTSAISSGVPNRATKVLAEA